jgi:hypothetical protein
LRGHFLEGPGAITKDADRLHSSATIRSAGCPHRDRRRPNPLSNPSGFELLTSKRWRVTGHSHLSKCLRRTARGIARLESTSGSDRDLRRHLYPQWTWVRCSRSCGHEAALISQCIDGDFAILSRTHLIIGKCHQ